MAFQPQMNRANVNVEVMIRPIDSDPLWYGVCTLGLWAGGDVLALDANEIAASPDRHTIIAVGTDANITGIGTKGTRDWRIRDLVAMYGKAPLTLEKVGVFRYGKVRVRIANDFAGCNTGTILQALEDSQTIEGQPTQTVGASIPMVWEVITTGAGAVDDDDIINLHTDLSECLGWSTNIVAAAAGGDESDRRAPLIMMLQPYKLLTSA